MIYSTALVSSMEQIRFVRFRYCDGITWVDAWTSNSPPVGIEMTVGFDPLPQETSADDYPFPYFRRVIAIPVRRPSGPKVTSNSRSDEITSEKETGMSEPSREPAAPESSTRKVPQ